MIPIDAVYEGGVLRPNRPIDLADGARVEIIVIPRAPSPGLGAPTPAEVASRIAAMPLQSPLDGFSGEDHDAILYGPGPVGVRLGFWSRWGQTWFFRGKTKNQV